MRTAFEILPASMDAENCSLLCEFSTEGFSYAIKDESKNSFLGLGVYHYDKTTPSVGYPIALQILFHQQPLLAKNFKKIVISYSLPLSVFVPDSIYSEQQSQDVLNLLHGDLSHSDIILNDAIENHQLHNCYRVPAKVYEVMENQFPNAVSVHQYSALMNQAVNNNDELRVIFYTQKIVVVLIKDGKQQLINSFNYETAEDVVYTLLNITRQFDIKEIKLKICGLVEENSALYKEIYKYFSDIELDTLPIETDYHEEISKYPGHYFSHIFALQTCE